MVSNYKTEDTMSNNLENKKIKRKISNGMPKVYTERCRSEVVTKTKKQCIIKIVYPVGPATAGSFGVKALGVPTAELFK